MGEFDLNLSTRPFPAYQLKSILLTMALIVLVALSAWQAYGFVQYSSLAAEIRGEVRNGEIESESLRRRIAEMDLKLSQPAAMAKLNEIEYLNDIILRKTLSWKRLFASLEELMPNTVHLVGLRPDFGPAGVLLHFEVRARSIPDIKDLIDALQSSPVFDEVKVSTQRKEQPSSGTAAGTDVDVALTAKYHPEREDQ